MDSVELAKTVFGLFLTGLAGLLCLLVLIIAAALITSAVRAFRDTR